MPQPENRVDEGTNALKWQWLIRHPHDTGVAGQGKKLDLATTKLVKKKKKRKLTVWCRTYEWDSISWNQKEQHLVPLKILTLHNLSPAAAKQKKFSQLMQVLAIAVCWLGNFPSSLRPRIGKTIHDRIHSSVFKDRHNLTSI